MDSSNQASPSDVGGVSEHGSRVGAWALLSLREFASADNSHLIGLLSSRYSDAGFRSLEADQVSAWEAQIATLRSFAREALSSQPDANSWHLALEYEIPRREKRTDAILLTPNAIVVLEFKIGARTFERGALWQAQDYRLDLADFQEASRNVPIEAVLIATDATSLPVASARDPSTGVWRANRTSLSEVVGAIRANVPRMTGGRIDPQAWVRAGYRPTPTIVEAARRVFAGHDVRELSHAYADNLSTTTGIIQRVIAGARRTNRRVICFVTGVPGAGKTLAGLTAMQDARMDQEHECLAAFMSGNGPLVKVLREALVRDRIAKGASRVESAREVELLVQNVHRFIETYGVRNPEAVPPEHVIAFDEAQRAWHSGKLGKRHKDVAKSEPELVLEIMRRPPGWSVVVALVGGGQEIHDGEAGLEEWGNALQSSRGDWETVVSPDVLRGGSSVAGHRLFAVDPPAGIRVQSEPAMHLSVSVRSPRAQRLADWVNCVMSLDAVQAREILQSGGGFRLTLTRDLETARQWLRSVATGSLRSGLLTSSGALRSRAHGLETDANFRKGYPFVRWFLDDRDDYRSSHYLEVPATDFECQGLELDYAGVCWGDDLTVSASNRDWTYLAMRGAMWKNIGDARKRQYLINKYRVLLTRAREGMVIWVPKGNENDATRESDRLDRTAHLLEAAGATLLER